VVEIEARRRVEQERLDGLKTPGERNRLGQFATPPALALEIARYAAELWRGRADRADFLDPAIGSGAFYSAFRQAFAAEAVGAACGVEVDPAFAAAARGLWGPTGLRVLEGDFTRAEPDHPYNLILTNPPYTRHHHLAREDKERLRLAAAGRAGVPLSGLAGLYAHFLLLADAWMADGGLAIWLIPSEFMDVNYGAAVRDYLTGRVTLRRIHRYRPADVQFADALVTSAIVVFEKSPPSDGHAVWMSCGGPLSAPATSESVPLATLRTARKWTAFPGAGGLSVPDPSGATLGNFFTIKRGLATGANGFFILDRAEARRRGIPEVFLRPILPGSRHIMDPSIEADADGYPRLEPSLVVIDCDRPEDELREGFPEFWSYLQEGRRRGIDAGYLASRRSPWYTQERRDPAPFLCTYMGRAGARGNPFRFFRNRSRAVAANVYLMLYPRGPLKAALERTPGLGAVVLSRLQSIAADRLIREGRVYGGGLHKLEPSELANLSADAMAGIVSSAELSNRAPAAPAGREDG
jgi:adenine-specific DNA-methyltransferase